MKLGQKLVNVLFENGHTGRDLQIWIIIFQVSQNLDAQFAFYRVDKHAFVAGDQGAVHGCSGLLVQRRKSQCVQPTVLCGDDNLIPKNVDALGEKSLLKELHINLVVDPQNLLLELSHLHKVQPLKSRK